MAKQLKFTVGNAATGYKTVEIFINGGKVSYKILRSGLLNVDKKNSPAAQVSKDWLAELDALNIFAWEENYSAESTDGTQWELILKDDKIYRGQGSNAYPDNWERFLDWLDALVPELEFINRKRLDKVTLSYSRESAADYKVFERLTVNRREKILALDKQNSFHLYNFNEDIRKILDTCQNFFDGLEVGETTDNYPAQIKIELVHHDGSIENISSPYSETFLPGLSDFIQTIQDFAPDLTAEIFKPASAEVVPVQNKYIFCKVRFEGSYKLYTYRTEDETLAVGDIVDVPVGKNNDVTQARLVEIGYFDDYEAPFPVDKIKMIIGKHVATSWENY